jgi:hypothetical protein
MKEPRHMGGQVSKILEDGGKFHSVSDPQNTGLRKGARPRIPSHKLRDCYT